MTDETLWAIIEQMPHTGVYHWNPTDVFHREFENGRCPRCKLEAWVREHAAQWSDNERYTKFKTRAMTYRAVIAALGVPLDTPAKVDQ